ncbi:hypothetical protein ACFWWC_03580 [Streptomyces sp. NPDC058642]|uniref:hypothetical protein n=1 Tax=Streptomyces sp. NPDC058642 TaxID=3346572 RepID=UPI00366504B2
MRIRKTAVTVAALAFALTACSSSASTDDESSKSSKTATTKAPSKELTKEQKDGALAAAGIPKEPTGADRAALLRALAAINPDIVKHEDKAIGAAQNQCGAINRDGQRLDHWAGERFTYRDVTTTEAQGKQINAALKDLGFCKV